MRRVLGLGLLLSGSALVTSEASAAQTPPAPAVIGLEATADPAQSRLMDEGQLAKLFDVLAPRYAVRNGGYTRIIKGGIRATDAAPIAIIATWRRRDRTAAR